jgi:Htaa
MRVSAKSLLPALALTAVLTVPASAGAVEATGNTTLVVSAGKAKVLAKRGIRLAGIRGATTEGRETRLQVAGGTIGSDAASLNNEGALRFLAGNGRSRRVVKLTGLQTRLGPNPSLSGKLKGKGKPRVLFDLRAQPAALSLDGLRGTASLRNARLVWRRGGANVVGKRLGVRIPKGALGTLRASAVAATGADTPVSGPIDTEPPLLARPASAVDVTGATVTWHVRDSWIAYANSEVLPAALDGVAPGAKKPEADHVCPDNPADRGEFVFDFTFPFANGWYDPPSGTTALYTGGAVQYRYPSRGINLTTRNPEIEINGAASRVIVRLQGSESTSYPDSRTAMLNLNLTGAPVESPPGTFTYSNPIRSSLDPNGQSIFAGFYPPPNNGFGCFSISFSTG